MTETELETQKDSEAETETETEALRHSLAGRLRDRDKLEAETDTEHPFIEGRRKLETCIQSRLGGDDNGWFDSENLKRLDVHNNQ